MQQRRGTAQQWLSTNNSQGPVLNAGEIGWESDTNKFKIGDGVNHWIDLDYFSTDSAEAVTQQINAAIASLVDGAPGLLNTLNELAAAINDDPTFFTTIATNLSNHESDTTNVHGILDTNELATKTFAAELLTNAAKSNITITGDKNGLTITAENGVSDSTTDNLTEGTTNKYFTNQRALDATSAAYDAAGSAATAQQNAEDYADNLASNYDAAGTATSAVAAHNLVTTNVHGILDTDELATKEYVTQEIGNATVDQSALAGVGIDWNGATEQFDIDSTVATKTYADNAAGAADTSARGYADSLATNYDAAGSASSAVSTHNSDSTSVHGIDDTAELATKTFAAELLTNATKTNVTITGDKNGLTITAENGVADSTTDNLTEGSTNKYFTDERAQDAVGNAVGTGLTYTDSTGEIKVTPNTYDAYGSASAVAGDLSTHASDTTSVHGITDTSKLVATDAVSTTLEGDLVVDGDFTVNGTNFAASATSITIEDNMVQLAHQNPVNTVDLGIVVGYNDGTAKHAGLVKDVSDNTWKLFKDVTTEPSTTVDFTQGSLDDLAVGTLTGNVSGNVTGDLTGNADTATALETARNIAGQSFDGTADISIAPTDLTGVTATASEINVLDGITATTEELNILDGVTATALELNVLDGITASTTELNYVDGVTSAIQTQLNEKSPTAGSSSITTLGTITTGTWSADTIAIDKGGTGATTASAAAAALLPSQSSNSGKYLTTDGAGTLSWGTVSGYSAPTIGTTSIASGATVTTISGLTLNNSALTGTLSLPTGSVTSTMIADATIVNADISNTAAIAQSKIANLTSDLAAASAANSNLFVAVSGMFSTNIAASSTDGITWAQRTLPSSASWISATYGEGLFVATTNGSAVATSTDGTSWTQRTMPANTEWHTVFYGNGTFVSFAAGNNIAASSTDGLTWTQRTLPSAHRWTKGIYANNRFVAMRDEDGSTHNTLALSTDGVTWTAGTMPSTLRWSSLTYGRGVFVAIAAYSTTTAISTDAITWTTGGSLTQQSTYWRSLAFGNGVFVALSRSNSTGPVNVSTDGITWTAATLPNIGGANRLIFGNGVFVAWLYDFFPSTIIVTSTDGITWTQRAFSAASRYTDVAYIPSYISRTTSIVGASQLPLTNTAYPVSINDRYLTFNTSSTTTLTLPEPGTFPGRALSIKQIGSSSIVSSLANIVPLNSQTPGVLILSGSNQSITLVSDGYNWISYGTVSPVTETLDPFFAMI